MFVEKRTDGTRKRKEEKLDPEYFVHDFLVGRVHEYATCVLAVILERDSELHNLVDV